jgi:hypothetical protein
MSIDHTYHILFFVVLVDVLYLYCCCCATTPRVATADPNRSVAQPSTYVSKKFLDFIFSLMNTLTAYQSNSSREISPSESDSERALTFRWKHKSDMELQ